MASTSRKLPSPAWFVTATILLVLGALFTDSSVVALLVAIVAGSLFLKVGFAVLGSMAQPVPEPPPAGELRKVKIEYRCSICGSEVRMTVANDEMPDPPKHCLEEMDLVTPVE